jgi:pimeloyl-ACP methyl ester carboxylesterase
MVGKTVSIPVSGRQLAGNLFRREGPVGEPGPGLLFIHGFGSDQSGYRDRARAALEAVDGVCLTFDLSGHGRSGSVADRARLTRRDHLADCVAAYDRLVSAGVAADRVGLCGASYGAYLAGLLTAERSVKRVLLRAPAWYDDRDFDVLLRERTRSEAGARSALLASSLGRFGGETLILESGADEVIPHEVIEAYLRIAAHPTHHVIKDAAHALTEPRWRETFEEEIKAWFAGL